MILITGGGGFIGLNLAKNLVDRGQKILLVRRHAFEVPSFLSPHVGKQVVIAQGDATEPAVLHSLIKSNSIESIIHAAVVTESSSNSTLYQAMKVNLQGTVDILEAARIFGLRRVTFLSSISVYMPTSENRKILSEEDDLPAISSEWIGGSKKAGEQICKLYAKQYGLSLPIVRPPQVWGPLYWTHRSPVHTMIESAIAGKPADLSGNWGGASSPFVYVRDCVKAVSLVHLASALKYNIYNIGEEQNRSLLDFAQAVRKVIPGAQIKLGEKKPDTDEGRPRMSIERIKSDLGYAPDYDLKRAVKAYIEWLRDGEYA